MISYYMKSTMYEKIVKTIFENINMGTFRYKYSLQ